MIPNTQLQFKTWAYGTRRRATILSVSHGTCSDCVVLKDEQNEGHILANQIYDPNLKNGDEVTLEFTQGGPMGGYWRIIQLMNQDIFKTVQEIIGEEKGVSLEQTRPDSLLGEDLGVDSLDALFITTILDEKYKIEISDEDTGKLETVADLVCLVERLVKAKGGAVAAQTAGGA